MQPYFTSDNITLYHGDFITTEEIPAESVDLIITSPPYAVGIGYDQYNDSAKTWSEYLKFSHDWLQKAFILTAPNGRLCLNIPLDKNAGGQQSFLADLTAVARAVGWSYQSTIIWNEGTISTRTAWGSWLSASAPFVIAPVETILILYKGNWKKGKEGESDITRNEFIQWTNGLWTFNGESAKRIGHPAPFPRELPRRCIKLFSYIGETVLDPFSGSGTTLIEAGLHGRRGIGFDISLDYCRLAKKRFLNGARQKALFEI